LACLQFIAELLRNNEVDAEDFSLSVKTSAQTIRSRTLSTRVRHASMPQGSRRLLEAGNYR